MGNSLKNTKNRIPKWLFRRIVLIVCALVPLHTFALDPRHQLSQYGHTAWRVQDGFFNGSPTSIAQTTDGYLWIGTDTGLVRFDGVRFSPFRPSAKEKLRSPLISSLMASTDGSLWIGTGGYLAHLKNGDLTSYLDPRGQISAIRQDRAGEVWVARDRVGDDLRGALCRVVGASLHCYGPSDGMPFKVAGPLVEGRDQDWWIATANQIAHWGNGVSKIYAPSSLKSVGELDGFTALAMGADGRLWAGLEQTGQGLGLQCLANNKWSPFVVKGFDSSNLSVSALLFDRDNSLWIGTTNAGIYRIQGQAVEHFQASDGLSSDSVNSFLEDHEGQVWVATTKGLDKFRDMRVVNFSKREGLSADQVDSVLAAHDGTIWVGNGALDAIRGAKVSTTNAHNGLPGREVTSLLEERNGRLLVGIDDKLFSLMEGKFTEIKQGDGTSIGTVEHITEASDGTVWVSPIVSPHKLVHIADATVIEDPQLPVGTRPYALASDAQGGVYASLETGDLIHYGSGKWKVIPLHRGPGSNFAYQLLALEDGSLLGATPTGVLGWKDGKAQNMTTQNGLPCNWIYSTAFDTQNTLWIYSRCGLLSIGDAELRRWWHDPEAKIMVRTLDILDGAEPAHPDFKPSVSISTDGSLWFANSKDLQRLDPLHLAKNQVAPPVHIEGIIADRKAYEKLDNVVLPRLTREVEIDYTALSFVIPQRVLFRYKLDGWEGEWQDAGTRRQAFYTNLRPGTYHFHVVACNDDGVWNEVGASTSFTISPAYYQTRWFEVLCVLGLAGVLWAIYLLRLRSLTLQIQERLGARMEERERIARELHDTLLQGFQGLVLRFQAVLKTLPKGQPAHQMLEQILDRADQVLFEGRQNVRDLREKGSSGAELVEVLSNCGEELALGHSSLFSLAVVGAPRAIEPVIFDECHRIAREALINAFQHSRAAKIEAEITYSESGISLTIRDDGDGIDADIVARGREGHWGLSGMRERAYKIGAKISIWSRPKAGTEIELTIPAKVAYVGTKPQTLWQRIKQWLKRAEEKRP